MWLCWLEPEVLTGIWNSLCWGLSLSKLPRQKVRIPALVFLCALYNLGCDFSDLLYMFNFLWNNCRLAGHLRKSGFDFGFLMIQRSVLLFEWASLQSLLHIFRCRFPLRLQNSLSLRYLDLGDWLASIFHAASTYYIHHQNLLTGAHL